MPMHAPNKKDIVVVVEGPNDSHDTILADLVKDARIKLIFFPKVDADFVGKTLEQYNGMEVYITEQTGSRPIFYKGILETQVENERTYNIRLSKAPNFANMHHYSRIREMIVMR